MTQKITTTESKQRLEKVYLAITSDDDGRVCKDIPESACSEQPQNFLRHVISLSAFKVADGLIDPKLILTWLFVQLGASAQLIGSLVPIREAGALLPQIAIAEWIRRRNKRKWVWAIGAFVQGLSVLCMAFSVLLLEKTLIIYAILCCLLVMSLARSFCSVSYKDVLGKTVSKTIRGTATGTSASIASLFVFIFGLLLVFTITEMTLYLIAIVLIVASILCFTASINFLYIKEEPGSVTGGENALSDFFNRISTVITDKQFLIFLSTRACLICTAVAPPFILMLSDYASQRLTESSTDLLDTLTLFPDGVARELGLLILASSLSGTLSSYIWGKLADASSRNVLIVAGLLALLVYSIIVLCLIYQPALLSSLLVIPLLLFIVMTAHQGVRIGRSTHLIDMSDENSRANYTAVSNTFIGLILTVSLIFGVIAGVFGLTILFSVFALMSLGAVIFSSFLNDVQNTH